MQDEKKAKGSKVKKGFLAVQVGLEEDNDNDDKITTTNDRSSGLQRFVIPIWYLYHPRFIGLLDRAHDIYGYQSDGPLRLPCSVDDFIHLRWQIERENTGGGCHSHHHHQVHHYFHQSPTSFRSC